MTGGRLPPALTAPLDIRWIDLDAAGPTDVLALRVSAEERARAARFVRPILGHRHLAAHAWLREHLGALVRRPPPSLVFDVGPWGKPSVPGIAFNLSHSDHLAAIATAPSGEIGVDIEVLKAMDDAEALAAHHFTPEERAELAAATDRTTAFLLGWTRKEACMKAAGCGLQVEPVAIATGLAGTSRRVSFDTPSGRVTAEVASWVDAGRAVVSWARLV